MEWKKGENNGTIGIFNMPNGRKEETMSGFEIEELTARIKGMTLDEQIVVAGSLQDDVLWGELQGRFTAMSAQLNNIRKEVM